MVAVPVYRVRAKRGHLRTLQPIWLRAGQGIATRAIVRLHNADAVSAPKGSAPSFVNAFINAARACAGVAETVPSLTPQIGAISLCAKPAM